MRTEVVDVHDRTVGRVLAGAARRFGDKALVREVGGRTVSYAEMDALANRLAHGLAAFGIQPGEPVLLMLPDTVDYIATWCGLARRGAVEVPVNLAYRGGFLSRIVNDSGAGTLVVDRRFLGRLEEVADELEHLQRLVLYSEGGADDTRLPPRLAGRFEACDFGALLSDDDSAFGPEPAFSDLIGIMYTSGTTGASKGVMVCHAHAFCYASTVAAIQGVGRDDVYYSAGLPLFHIAGQWGVVYGSMIHGATVVLRNGYRNEQFWPDVAGHGCTVAFLLGAIANFLWQQPRAPDDTDTPLAKVGMYPVIPEHEAFARRFGVRIATGYGSTENPGSMIHPFGEPFPDNQCVGRAAPGMQVKILDGLDRECPRGEVGEICVRPDQPWSIMLGYWRQPEATARAFRNLWYHSGDAGFQDEEGRLYFVDRLSDSIRRRGENISSMEVEDEVNRHPGVLECAAFPVKAETEDEVMVVITPKPGTSVDPEALVGFLDTRMPRFAVPRYVEITGAIPKTPTGKIRKYALRERGVTDATWDRIAAGARREENRR